MFYYVGGLGVCGIEEDCGGFEGGETRSIRQREDEGVLFVELGLGGGVWETEDRCSQEGAEAGDWVGGCCAIFGVRMFLRVKGGLLWCREMVEFH